MKTSIPKQHRVEELLAEVASAAHRATQQQGSKGAFIDVELDVWYALQARLRGPAPGNIAGQIVAGGFATTGGH